MLRPTIASAAAEILRTRRAMTAEDLGREIAARGLTRARQPAQAVSNALNEAEGFRRTSDGRWTVPEELIRGVTFTHRLSSVARDQNILPLGADLAVLLLSGPRQLRLPGDQPLALHGGGEALAKTEGAADFALQGPAGWLPRIAADLLLYVTVTNRIVDVAPGPEPAPATRMAARRITELARRRLQEEAAHDPFMPPVVFVDQLVLDLLVDEPDLFAQPLAPLAEVFTGAGLEVRREWVGLPGTDWAPVEELLAFDNDGWLDETDDEWPDEDGDADEVDDAAAAARVARALGLTATELEGLRLILATYGASRDRGTSPDESVLRKLATVVDVSLIAAQLAARAWSDPGFETFAAAIEGAARPSEAAGVRYVLAVCAEARGDIGLAERRLLSALESDARSPLALAGLARYDTDRGDYSSALRRLRAAGVRPDDPERAWLESFVGPASFARVGRNDPCPCGSGRKYKACHLDAGPQVGPIPPAVALLHKLDVWLAQPDQERLAEDVLRKAHVKVKDDDGTAQRLGPLVGDVILIERGQLRRFVEVRGPLLPAPERELARRWTKTRRSLYEVVSVVPGSGITLRDLRSGEQVDVRDRTMSLAMQPLDLVLMRPVPDDAGAFLATDGVTVPRPQRERVLNLLEERNPAGLLRWLASPLQIPRMSNMEGEPIVLVTATYRVPDPARARRAVGRRLRDDGSGHFSDAVTLKGQEWHRGSIVFDGDEATIDTNSKERADRLAGILLKAAPGVRLIRREERGVEEEMAAMAETRLKSGSTGESPEPDELDPADHPELAAALQDFIRKAEVRWVDEKIPALGGITPRQALTDPATRPRLDAMLDDMAWQKRRARPGAGLMDPDRVRGLLGLPPKAATGG